MLKTHENQHKEGYEMIKKNIRGMSHTRVLFVTFQLNRSLSMQYHRL